MSLEPITEDELLAYADGRLPAVRVSAVEQHLAQHEEDARRVAAWRNQGARLHAAYDPWLDAPLPFKLPAADRPRWITGWPRYAAAALVMVASGLIGWHLHGHKAAEDVRTVQLARIAAVAHAVYSPDKRHPVEVGADQEAHLTQWLSKRLGASLKVPHLDQQGYALVGGRLLASERGPAAQFMYQDSQGMRLTLYVRADSAMREPMGFRFSREKEVGVLYWIDGRLGYALSGELGREPLLRVAEAVQRQLQP